jgi:hypothetical protein
VNFCIYLYGHANTLAIDNRAEIQVQTFN